MVKNFFFIITRRRIKKDTKVSIWKNVPVKFYSNQNMNTNIYNNAFNPEI